MTGPRFAVERDGHVWRVRDRATHTLEVVVFPTGNGNGATHVRTTVALEAVARYDGLLGYVTRELENRLRAAGHPVPRRVLPNTDPIAAGHAVPRLDPYAYAVGRRIIPRGQV